MITANVISAYDTIVLTKSHSVADIVSQLFESNLGPNIKFSTTEQRRNGRDLAVTFPFDQVPSRHPHQANQTMPHEDNVKLHLPHDHNHTGLIAGESFPNREARQRIRNRLQNTGRGGGQEYADFEGSGNENTDTESVTFEETVDAKGRCINKIEMKEVTEYDDEVQCRHSYSEQCYQSYITKYKPSQKQECDDEFVKSCRIQYKTTAQQESVRKCTVPLICAGNGLEVCRIAHTTVCETKNEVHEVMDDVANCKTIFESVCEDVRQGYVTKRECKKWPKVKCNKITQKVKKLSPISVCRSEPIEVCGPKGCELEPGEKVCVDEEQIISSLVCITITSTKNEIIACIQFWLSIIIINHRNLLSIAHWIRNAIVTIPQY